MNQLRRASLFVSLALASCAHPSTLTVARDLEAADLSGGWWAFASSSENLYHLDFDGRGGAILRFGCLSFATDARFRAKVDVRRGQVVIEGSDPQVGNLRFRFVGQGFVTGWESRLNRWIDGEFSMIGNGGRSLWSEKVTFRPEKPSARLQPAEDLLK
jgi:hypothetical protein